MTISFGDPLAGGFYAGPHPTDPKAVLIFAPRAIGSTRAPWKKAVAFCEEVRAGGFDDWRAPTRIEALVGFLNLSQGCATADAFKEGGEEAFPKEWHWTGEEYEFAHGYAWAQDFDHGLQNYGVKGNGLRVRAVRKAPVALLTDTARAEADAGAYRVALHKMEQYAIIMRSAIASDQMRCDAERLLREELWRNRRVLIAALTDQGKT